MLQTIRDRTQGIIATIIVGIVALTFAIWGIHYYLEESKSSTVVVKVNSSKLTQDNFERILRRNQRLFSLANPDAPFTDSVQKKMQKVAIDQWIQKTLLSQAASHERFVVSPAMLRDTLANLEMFQENGRFSPALYQQRIDALGYTPQEFQQNLQDELLIGQVRYGLAQSAFVLPNELNDAVGTLYQTRDMGYLLIPGKSFLNSVVINPAAIKQYYDAHLQNFMDPEKVKIEYIQIKPDDLKQQIPVSDADIKNYYDSHLADYSSVPQWQIRFVKLTNKTDAQKTLQEATALRDAMVKDKSFVLAQKQGLNLNELWVTSASVPAELASVLVKSQVGEWLMPVATKDGVLIVQVEANKPAEIKPLAMVKNSIQERLQNQNADKLMSSLSDQLDSLSYEDPTNLANVAEKLKLPLNVSDWLTAQSGNNSSFAPAVIQAAFSDDVLQQGYNSNLITLNDGSVMVLRIRAHQVSQAKPLAAVQDQIKGILTTEAIKKASKAKGDIILQSLQQGQDPKALAQKNGLIWQETSHIARTSTGVNPEIIAALFNTTLIHKENQPILAAYPLSNGDYLVLRVEAIHRGEANQLSNKDKIQLAQQWAQAMGQMDDAFYERSVRDAAKIKVDLPKNALQNEDE